MLLRASTTTIATAARAALRRPCGSHVLRFAPARCAPVARWFSTDESSTTPTPASSSSSSSSNVSEAAVLPTHIKFRMPDLDFEHISGGNAVVTLTKWHVREGDEVKDGAQMCEIDTPDLNFVLESGDVGFIAKIFVQEGASNVTPNQPLLAIVPDAADIAPFVDALRANPRAIEGYVEPEPAVTTPVESTSSHAPSPASDVPEGSDVLRMLQKLQKDGRFRDEKQLKVLKSLARKNDEQLLVTFRGSFATEAFDDATFDHDFFVENALELADEALAREAASDKTSSAA